MSWDYEFKEFEEEMRARSTDEMIKWSWSVIERIKKERDDAHESADRFNLDRE